MAASFKAKWKMNEAKAIINTQGSAAIRAAGNYLLAESRKQVPLDTGALQRSGAVSVDGTKGCVSYDTPYAIRVHEEHLNFQRGRKRKYLEDPCNDPIIRGNILKYLKGGMNF